MADTFETSKPAETAETSETVAATESLHKAKETKRKGVRKLCSKHVVKLTELQDVVDEVGFKDGTVEEVVSGRKSRWLLFSSHYSFPWNSGVTHRVL
jgi:hypothetical protein